jgi:hypothetical protein
MVVRSLFLRRQIHKVDTMVSYKVEDLDDE